MDALTKMSAARTRLILDKPFLGALVLLGLRRPFIWVLAYLYVDIVAPQKIGWVILPSVQASLLANHEAALLKLPSGSGWRFRSGGAAIRLEDSIYMGRRGDARRTQQLVLTGETGEGESSDSQQQADQSQQSQDGQPEKNPQ